MGCSADSGISMEVKTFDQLTTRELYEILKTRAAVFIVEQNCAYQDLDDIDFKSTHLMLYSDGELVAYSRVFKDDESDLWHIGRVLTTQRNKHFGLRIMEEAIRVAKEMDAQLIEIEAQSYAIGFYEQLGFEVSSDEFLLDGILHRRMLLHL